MMPQVPMVEDRDIDRDDNDLVQVTSLAVDLSKNRSALYLEVGAYHEGQPDGRHLLLALTPQAAKHLAEWLEQTVDDYLHSGPK